MFILSLSAFRAAEIASSPFVSLGLPGNDKFFVGARHAVPVRLEMPGVVDHHRQPTSSYRLSFVGFDMRYENRVVGNRKSKRLVFLFNNAFRGRQPSFEFQYLYPPSSSQAPNSHPNAEGVAQAGEASGRPQRMSKDGIGGVADDSSPVAQSATPAGARGIPPPPKTSFRV